MVKAVGTTELATTCIQAASKYYIAAALAYETSTLVACTPLVVGSLAQSLDLHHKRTQSLPSVMV
jgi:hypothetical protein